MKVLAGYLGPNGAVYFCIINLADHFFSNFNFYFALFLKMMSKISKTKNLVPTVVVEMPQPRVKTIMKKGTPKIISKSVSPNDYLKIIQKFQILKKVLKRAKSLKNQ